MPAAGFGLAGTLTTPPATGPAAASRPSCWWPGPVPIDRDADGRRHSAVRAAGRAARRTRFRRPALRQARRRQERRANRARHARGLRRRRRRRGQVAGQTQGRRLGTHLRRRPQRGCGGGDARGGTREEDRRPRADGGHGHSGPRADPRTAAAAALEARSLSEAERADKSGAAEADSRGRRRRRKAGKAFRPRCARAADTPWYRSLRDVRPGRGDGQSQAADPDPPGRARQAGPALSRRPAGRARRAARKKAASVEVKQLPALNHLFVPPRPATSPNTRRLETKVISSEVSAAIAAWVASVPR